jgi:hypothetical protein
MFDEHKAARRVTRSRPLCLISPMRYLGWQSTHANDPVPIFNACQSFICLQPVCRVVLEVPFLRWNRIRSTQSC